MIYNKRKLELVFCIYLYHLIIEYWIKTKRYHQVELPG